MIQPNSHTKVPQCAHKNMYFNTVVASDKFPVAWSPCPELVMLNFPNNSSLGLEPKCSNSVLWMYLISQIQAIIIDLLTDTNQLTRVSFEIAVILSWVMYESSVGLMLKCMNISDKKYCNVEGIITHITPHVCTLERARPSLFCSYKHHCKKVHSCFRNTYSKHVECKLSVWKGSYNIHVIWTPTSPECLCGGHVCVRVCGNTDMPL